VNQRELSPQRLKIFNIHIIYTNQYISDNILNFDGTGMLRLFLTKMFVTMTPHSWQQTEITWKFGQNVAKISSYSHISMAKKLA